MLALCRDDIRNQEIRLIHSQPQHEVEVSGQSHLQNK
jgi:hypothetical protein